MYIEIYLSFSPKLGILNEMNVSYQVTPVSWILDNSQKRYILRLRDLPPSEKPREKLLKFGAPLLSMHELLAILLNVGTKKEEVLAMSSRILKEYGQKSIVGYKDPNKLAQDYSIPLVKATQIVACIELGRRFFQKTATKRTIRTPKDVFIYARDISDASKEHLRGIYLNAHYKILHDEVISIGTVDANIIHPREVFKPALEYCAAAVILVHNHPSGMLTPSDADVAITRQLVSAGKLLGIDLIDHVIVTKHAYASIFDHLIH